MPFSIKGSHENCHRWFRHCRTTSAYRLHPRHLVTLFEAAPRLGGHSNTVTVDLPEGKIPVDTGFIVFNDWTYPNFISLMKEIGIEGKATEMSFSVKDEQRDFEYNGHTLDTLFAQRRNLVGPCFTLGDAHGYSPL